MIAVSEDVRRDLIRYDGIAEEKIVTIQNGIDVGRIGPPRSRVHEARVRLGIGGDEIVIGCVARLEEQKGTASCFRGRWRYSTRRQRA